MEESWSPEPIRAWRYFRLSGREWDWDNHQWRFYLRGIYEVWEATTKEAGVHHGSTWEHDSYSTREVPFSHASPSLGCPCGINAVKTLTMGHLDELSAETVWLGAGGEVRTGVRFPVAISPVLLSGKVDEYETGYRAEKAEIVGPVTIIGGDQEMADLVAATYGIPAFVESWSGPLVKALVTHGEEYEDGHRETDQKNHRGTGTGQGTHQGTGEGTRKGWNLAKRISFALGVQATYVIGSVVWRSADNQWTGSAAWVGACLVAGVLLAGWERFIRRT